MKYHDKKINKRPPQFLYKLNPESDRYRICKNCGTELMATHRTRIYCDDKCSDEYHNAQKRYNRDMKKLNEEIEKETLESLKNSNEEIPNESINETTIDETSATVVVEPDETILNSNMSILESLNIHKKGSYYSIESLHSYGFKFSHYSGRGELFNIDSKHNCHFIQVGNFRLYRVSYSTLLIINLIYLSLHKHTTNLQL